MRSPTWPEGPRPCEIVAHAGARTTAAPRNAPSLARGRHRLPHNRPRRDGKRTGRGRCRDSARPAGTARLRTDHPRRRHRHSPRLGNYRPPCAARPETAHQNCGVETPDFRPGGKRRSPFGVSRLPETVRSEKLGCCEDGVQVPGIPRTGAGQRAQPHVAGHRPGIDRPIYGDGLPGPVRALVRVPRRRGRRPGQLATGAGRHLIVIGRYPRSKTCSACGHLLAALSLSTRT